MDTPENPARKHALDQMIEQARSTGWKEQK